MIGEISYDLIMEDDMAFATGTYRVEQGEWEVFISAKAASLRPTGERQSGGGE